MDKFKGTKGPWIGKEIKVRHAALSKLKSGIVSCNYQDEEADANSRLIVAAPDLLECCLEIREAIAYFSEYDLPLGWDERMDSAIKKALGEL